MSGERRRREQRRRRAGLSCRCCHGGRAPELVRPMCPLGRAAREEARARARKAAEGTLRCCHSRERARALFLFGGAAAPATRRGYSVLLRGGQECGVCLCVSWIAGARAIRFRVSGGEGREAAEGAPSPPLPLLFTAPPSLALASPSFFPHSGKREAAPSFHHGAACHLPQAVELPHAVQRDARREDAGSVLLLAFGSGLAAIKEPPALSALSGARRWPTPHRELCLTRPIPARSARLWERPG